MRGYVQRCGHMARMFSLGKSKDSRELWALELSNDPGATEAKPNARYIGNMHGDEPASRFLLYLSKLAALCLHIFRSFLVSPYGDVCPYREQHRKHLYTIVALCLAPYLYLG